MASNRGKASGWILELDDRDVLAWLAPNDLRWKRTLIMQSDGQVLRIGNHMEVGHDVALLVPNEPRARPRWDVVLTARPVVHDDLVLGDVDARSRHARKHRDRVSLVLRSCIGRQGCQRSILNGDRAGAHGCGVRGLRHTFRPTALNEQ